MTSFPVTWLPSPASYSFVGSEMPSYTHFQVTSGQMTSLPFNFSSRGHMTSLPFTWLPLPASHSPVGAQNHTKREFSASYSNFQVTSSEKMSFTFISGYVMSHDIISCDVTATSCELQSSRSSKLTITGVFGNLHSLPCNFLSRDCHLLRVATL